MVGFVITSLKIYQNNTMYKNGSHEKELVTFFKLIFFVRQY